MPAGFERHEDLVEGPPLDGITECDGSGGGAEWGRRVQIEGRSFPELSGDGAKDGELFCRGAAIDIDRSEQCGHHRFHPVGVESQ